MRLSFTLSFPLSVFYDLLIWIASYKSNVSKASFIIYEGM